MPTFLMVFDFLGTNSASSFWSSVFRFYQMIQNQKTNIFKTSKHENTGKI